MNKNEYILACLIEEAAEVQQAATKFLRFGEGDRYPASDSPTNRDKLAGELADLLGVLELARDAGLVPDIPITHRDAIQAKKEKFFRFMGYSKRCGILDEEGPR